MRRFEFVEGSSSKFWSPELQGNTFIVTYGRIGTAGQRKEKAFPDEESARREYEKKVAEKLREGYREVTEGGEAPAPAASKEKAPPPRPELPPRLRPAKPTAEQVAAAAQALSVLEARLGKRSWQVNRQARRARRALRRLAGVDPASHPALNTVFESLMGRVTAPPGQRLPLRLAMSLLGELDVAAFVRASQRWKSAAAGAPAAVAREAEALAEPELALRMGLLLTARPELRGSSEVGWQRRWNALKPYLEAHLQEKGGALQTHLQAIEAGGDAHLAQRVARMGA
ncbi:WGR domain-containing protein [Hyalangium gracile]|uniref:WGR domain-containing protein n=1 Tax=Hyalangium gracile TaxID=394092 RepID=UPI001CCFF124|nr:WGR domain-containing protein [Hyalangium gracile]